MKTLLFFFVVGSIVGCATSQVNVDYNSCVMRGIIDETMIANCKEVKSVK